MEWRVETEEWLVGPVRDAGTDHSRVRQQIFMTCFLNMDAQDNQDGTLLH